MSIVRYFNAYGPRIDESGYGSVIARFAGQAMSGAAITVHGDGQQTRCFTYVTDTVSGTIRAATSSNAIGHVVNIGGSEEVTILALAEKVRAIFGSRSPIELVPYESWYPRGFQDTRRRVPDTTRARELIGFQAAVPLDEGLRTTLEWCRANYTGAVAAR
jgi:UDP-glucose 4-epimerase